MIHSLTFLLLAIRHMYIAGLVTNRVKISFDHFIICILYFGNFSQAAQHEVDVSVVKNDFWVLSKLGVLQLQSICFLIHGFHL